jgi:hypothetical protein
MRRVTSRILLERAPLITFPYSECTSGRFLYDW